MKRYILSLLMTALATIAVANMWQTHTNTSHVFDILAEDGEVWFSSWGGVVRIGAPVLKQDVSLSDMRQKEMWNTGNGLISNDIRRIVRIGFSSSMWFASDNSGISIVSPLGVQALDSSLGLPSNRVKKIVENQNRILVATYSGLAEYYYLEGVNFPLLLHQYNVQNTNGALLSNELDAMVLAPNRYLWLGSTSGINYVHLDSLAVDSAWHVLSVPFGTGHTLRFAVNDEVLAIATAQNVYLRSSDLAQNGWTSYSAGNQLPNETISDIALNDDNTLWISYGNWNEDTLIYSRNTANLLTSVSESGTVTNYTENANGLKRKSISRIVCSDGYVYLGSWGEGIYRLENGSWAQYLPNSIGFPKVTHINTDLNYEVWISNGSFNHLPTRKSALGASRWKDGVWQTMNIANSPIHSDNILTIAVDSKNRKWFGTYDVITDESPVGWLFGLTVWDEETDVWMHFTRFGVRYWNHETNTWGPFLPGSPTLMSNTIGYIARDMHDNMLVAGYDRGFSVFNADDELIGEFEIPNSVYQRGIFIYHNGRQYFIGTQSDRGLMIWNDDSIPDKDGPHWITPSPAELSNCEIYGVVSIESPYEGPQHWIAASNGLFMWNEQYWYKYDTAIKRYRYNLSTGLWDNDLLYYADEERLYGSVRTYPTAIYLDPFNRIWIGSLANGISMYDPSTERFTNYYQANSPLLSNHITMFGYEPTEGLLLIGTPDGLNTLRIGRTVKPQTTLQQLKAYPNPFRPAVHSSVLIVNQPTDVMPQGLNSCRVYDSSGALVAKLEETNFSRFEWDGKTSSGKLCASGVYFFVVSDESGKSKRGKIVLIR